MDGVTGRPDSQTGFRARFFARARFRCASSLMIASFGTVSDLRNARSKFLNWFGPLHLASRSAIVSDCDFMASSCRARSAVVLVSYNFS
jgi:hypothetical protein